MPDFEREVAKVDISKNMSLCLCRDASYKSGAMSFNPSFEQFTSLQFEAKQAASFKDFYGEVVRYESFLSLATFIGKGKIL